MIAAKQISKEVYDLLVRIMVRLRNELNDIVACALFLVAFIVIYRNILFQDAPFMGVNFFVPSPSMNYYFTGLFSPRFKSKGVFDLISIWGGVCKKRPTAKLAILGDGPEKEQLAMLVIKMGLEKNVTFFGFVFGTEKSIIVANSKIFLFPSYLESWGISIAEAMAAGLPVVAYNLPIYPDVFGDKLIITPVGDIDAMIGKVIYLLDHPEIANRVGQSGKDFIRKYEWTAVAAKELSRVKLIKG